MLLYFKVISLDSRLRGNDERGRWNDIVGRGNLHQKNNYFIIVRVRQPKAYNNKKASSNNQA
jgi:hypothetical protein